MPDPLVSGGCFGVNILPHGDRGAHNKGARWIEILVEDDGNWNPHLTFDSSWLPELQKILTQIAKKVKKNPYG